MRHRYLSDTKDVWVRFKRNHAAVIGLVIIASTFTLAVAADFIAPYRALATYVGPRLQPPSWSFPMGTDLLGRDVWSGYLYGTRIALLVGFTTAVASVTIGFSVGMVSGFVGGLLDDVLMRITELFMVLPDFILAIVIVVLYGSSLWNVILVISLLSWPTIARIIRAEVLSLKEREFVDAAKTLGAGKLDIMFIELLPNTFPLITVSATLQISSAILVEAGLSFLGLSDPTVLSWGRMLYEAQQAFQSGAWWIVVFPGIAIAITAIAFNLMGDGLNDALNPKLR